MFYTGIGSRSTPDDILIVMYDIAKSLASKGWTLRSGGADGADSAFEVGCISASGMKEVFLPWKRFNENDSPYFDIPPAAVEIAQAVYGARWDYIKRPVKLLMSRNVQQVLGKTLDNPSAFVVCWTQDGITDGSQRTIKSGGTGQAIAVASRYDIPVFNLATNSIEDVYDFVSQYKE